MELSPGIIRGLLDRNVNKPEDLLVRGWESLQRSPMQLIVELYEQIVAAARHMADVLADEAVKALEQKTALLSMGEYVAHRQVWQMAIKLEQGLPKYKITPRHGRRQVPTRVLDEDTYPVGGFASISNRGSIESLLHSQLAYMEKEKELQPDLFDIRFLRDELYYYSRDENQFLRRRRTFLFALMPDLVQARFKDAELPCQRMVLALALLLELVRKLSDWLGNDSLRFEFLFILEGDKKILEEERKLLALLFREEVENRSVSVEHLPATDLVSRIKQSASRSLCHCLALGVKQMELQCDEAAITSMVVDGPRPSLKIGRDAPVISEAEEPFDSWLQTLIRLLEDCLG